MVDPVRTARATRPSRPRAARERSAHTPVSPEPATALSAGQLAFVFEPPQPRQPADPPLPTVPRRRGPLQRQIEALCRCPSCAVTFADETALLAHRPKDACLDPEQAGLTRQPQPVPCWATPKETR